MAALCVCVFASALAVQRHAVHQQMDYAKVSPYHYQVSQIAAILITAGRNLRVISRWLHFNCTPTSHANSVKLYHGYPFNVHLRW